MHALYCINEHYTFINVKNSSFGSFIIILISLIYFHLNIRVGTKKCQDSKLSLNPSSGLKGINIIWLRHFIHINNMIEVYYMTVAIYIQRPKFLKTFRNKWLSSFRTYCLIMHDLVKFLVSGSILTIVAFVSRHMLGEDLGPLSIKELQQLEKQLEYALSQARQRKVWSLCILSYQYVP